jgi:alpha-ribazole phosphatase
MKLQTGATTRIILIRHGEPSATAQGLCYGKSDVELSPRGQQQAFETADFLSDFEVAAIYSSPRRRSLETARILAEKQNLFVEIQPRFAEIDFGDFENVSYAEVERRFPEIYRQWMRAPTEIKFPNGESFAEMRHRVLLAINELMPRHVGETFAVVSHGGVNRIILANALKMADKDIFRLAQDYAAINVIDFYKDFPVVKILNLTAENLRR